LLLCLLGTVYLDISADFQTQTREYHDEAAVMLEQPMGDIFGATAWAELGFCGLELGKLDMAHDHFKNGLDTATAMMYLARPQLLVGQSLLALAHGDLDGAAQYVHDAQEYVVERSMCQDYPLVYLAAGRISAAQGQMDAALEKFDQAEQFAASMGMRPIIWKARCSAAEVLEAAGQHGEAAAKWAGARAMIDEIAAGFDDEELRRKYLNNCASKLKVAA
jgi:tetratricopeptide (TPR) repeat protein